MRYCAEMELPELFPAILHALKPKKILIPVPSFYGYEWAAGTEACEVSYFPLREQDNFVLGRGLY